MAENNDEHVEHEDDSISDMARRHIRLGLRMQAVAIAALEELERKMASGEPLNLSARDAKTLLDTGAKLERAALGEKEQYGDDATIPAPKKPN